MDEPSGVGVIDKAVTVLAALAQAPRTLAELVEATGLSRPTAHRLAIALEHHGLVGRTDGRFALGPRIGEWASPHLLWGTEDAVRALRDATGESAQVFRRAGDERVCVAAAEPTSGLRDTVPVGARLSMRAGSAAQVLCAWLDDASRAPLLRGAAFDAAVLADVRERGWAHSVGQREPGVASLAAPVTDADGNVVAALSISGPIERLAKPTAALRRTVLRTAAELSAMQTSA